MEPLMNENLKIQKTMNKRELMDAISEDSGLSITDCKRVFESMIKTIEKGLKEGKKITIVNFGSFEVFERHERAARNRRTREIIKVPATKYPKFKAGKPFRDAIS